MGLFDAYAYGEMDRASLKLFCVAMITVSERPLTSLAQATARVQPPTDKGRRLKIYYVTQPSTRPPTFVFFVNRADLFHFSYQRYLENQLRETFGFEGTPIRFIIRERGDKSGK